MQVFITSTSLRESVSVLDKSRLGNQIYREAYTLLNDGWSNHPAYKAWEHNKAALCLYCLEGIKLLINRQWISNTKALEQYDRFSSLFQKYAGPAGEAPLPWWLQDEAVSSLVIRSHKLNLLYKDPVWYSQFNWGLHVPLSKPEYFWPVY